MRILFIANDSTYMYNMRREMIVAMKEQGHEVSIVCEPEGYLTEWSELSIPVIFVKTGRRGTNPFRDLRLMHRYRRILKSLRPQMVFTNNIKPNAYAGMQCAALHIPYVANVTGLGTSIENGGLLSRLTLFLYKRGLRKARTVFFQNESNLAFFKEKGVVSGDSKVVLLPGSGVNLQKNPAEDYPSDEQGIHVLFVGRIMRDKGIGELLCAAPAIHKNHPEVFFDLVGSYDDLSYRPLIEKLQEEGVLRYHGTSKCVHEFMKKAHVIVSPSYHEGLSNVLLEAAASARPILASDVHGCRETLMDGESGMLFTPGDAGSLTEALNSFLALTNETRAEMGRKGHAFVAQHFDRQTVVQKYIEELETKEGK